MKIAFISYEFPPETAFGGIGMYTLQLSAALAERGHHVEVFSCSREKDVFNVVLDNTVVVHRVKAMNRNEFSRGIVEIFGQRNAIVPFDVIESPEYCAEGLAIKKTFPQLPMIVKLHTPNFMVKELNYSYNKLPLKKRIKKILGIQQYQKENDPDYQLAVRAEAICSPSAALVEKLQPLWGLKHVTVIPNYFKPAQSFLDVPVAIQQQKVIAYIGRLDVRKGVLALAAVIPQVLKKHPDTIFKFIGADGEAPNGKGSMKNYILSLLQKHSDHLVFTGYATHEQIPSQLQDVCMVVLPSIWENYPYACLDAMSAGKAIVASKHGGMKEMLQDVDGGILIEPSKPASISNAINHLLSDPQQCREMGMRNRQQTLSMAEEIVSAVEHYYQSVIETAAKRNIVSIK